MRILINASNIAHGGASQVAISVCETLNMFPQHNFLVVASPAIASIKSVLLNYDNVNFIEYSVSRSIITKLTGRDSVLDSLVSSHHIDFVLSVFGPTWWVPRVGHLCGFALAHIVMPESPYFKRMSLSERVRSKINIEIMKYFYWRSSTNFYTENEMITARLKNVFKRAKIYTVTNFYNQVFDEPDRWRNYPLPEYEGKTFLSISSHYPHKNLELSIDVANYLKRTYPDFQFRFVFTIDESKFPQINEELRNHFLFIGPVPIETCPSLYEKSDVVFQPTLLECFTAVYPEAMRMRKPIVTTDLSFARGLCGESALYYNPLSVCNAAECLYMASCDAELSKKLIDNGISQLKQFDHYSVRASKLISLCEKLYSERYM